MFGQRMPEIAGGKVYIVPATSRNGTLLGDACRHQGEDFDRYRAEVARLSANRFARSHGVRPVSQGGRAAAALRTTYDDSLTLIPRPSQVGVDSLAMKLSVKTAVIDSSGHFSFGSLRRGPYYLVIPGIGWWGVDGKQWPVHLTIRMDDMQDACSAIG